MSKVRLYGATSGYVDLQAPAVAGDVTITLPNASGPFALESYVDDEIAAIPPLAGIGSNVVQAVKTDTFSTTSDTFNTVTGLSATITPSSSNSKILVVVQLAFSLGAGVGFGHFKVVGGNTSTYVGSSPGSRVAAVFGGTNFNSDNPRTLLSGSMIVLDSPATTSATTYEVQCRRSDGSGSAFVNRSAEDNDNSGRTRGASSITLIEVKA